MEILNYLFLVCLFIYFAVWSQLLKLLAVPLKFTLAMYFTILGHLFLHIAVAIQQILTLPIFFHSSNIGLIVYSTEYIEE